LTDRELKKGGTIFVPPFLFGVYSLSP